MKVIAELDGAVGVYDTTDEFLHGFAYSCRIGEKLAAFGWDDVTLLRGIASWAPPEWPRGDVKMHDLAARLAAILPPREP